MMKKSLVIGFLGAALALAPLSVYAKGAVGTIVTAEGQSTGTITWRNSAREYIVATDNSRITISADDVVDIRVKRPAELDAAIKKVKAGGAGVSSAIPTLKTIVDDYSHLTYDREAARWLAEANLAQGNAAAAVKACEDIIRNDEEAAYKGPMAIAYWRALSKDGKGARLNTLLNKAIASGDQTAAAHALVQRGNAAMDRGSAAVNCKEALSDGYLRVILLYSDQTEAYAEALYMGAKAFDGMQQGARADKLRQKLKAECPTSEWARK